MSAISSGVTKVPQTPRPKVKWSVKITFVCARCSKEEVQQEEHVSEDGYYHVQIPTAWGSIWVRPPGVNGSSSPPLAICPECYDAVANDTLRGAL